jgi:hypothetical protein
MLHHISFVFLFAILWYLLWNQIGDISWFTGFLNYLQYTLLAIGLYGAVYGIDLGALQQQKKTALIVVTLGVCFKILFIWGILYIVTGLQISWLLGAILGQIDPLSTAKLSGSSKLSQSGKSLLNTRASFDDPMTVLIAMYMVVPFLFVTWQSIGGGYIMWLWANILFAGLIYIATRLFTGRYIHAFLLIYSFFVAVYFQRMLGIALIALFLRPEFPNFSKNLDLSVQIAFFASVFLLGIYMSGWRTGNIWYGILLWVVVYISQIIATYLCVHTVSHKDKKFLAFAQYNGITSIILATTLSIYDPTLVGYTAIAIITITLLYMLSNHLLWSQK